MRRKQVVKLLVDLLMVVCVLLAMANRLTGNHIHELTGIIMFALLLLHNLLNWQWYSALLRGKYDLRRWFDTLVNLLLVAVSVTMAISSLIISRWLFLSAGMEGSLLLQQIHTTAAYWLLLLMSVHLGRYWRLVVNSLAKLSPLLSLDILPTPFRGALALTVVIYGGMAVLEREIFSRLIMLYAFDYWDFDQQVALFFVKYLAIIAAGAIFTHYIHNFFQCARDYRERNR